MPVSYPAGIVAEHTAVRTRAGLFDVCHMGELYIRGGDALGLVQHVTTNDAAALAVGQCQYSAICQEDGTVLDDCLVYRFAGDYMIVVNASNQARDRDWIRAFAGKFGTDVLDRGPETALLALQGPAAQRILQPLVDIELDGIAYYHFALGQVAGHEAVISRTGYTGEDGFELYLRPAENAVPLWRALLREGESVGIQPVGLGARDSLRLEMGYMLYGNDLDEQHTPLEAGLGWITKLDKGDFCGRAALQAQKRDGPAQRLVGFELQERGFPRHGYTIVWQGEPSGTVTSGLLSPTVERGIGMGWVPAAAAAPDTPIEILIRDRLVPARVVRPPFYRGGSIHRGPGYT
jgi:aminomethyltransferase